MTFLPIAQRELRVSARSRATRRWRILFALGAVVVAGAVGFIMWRSHGMFGVQAGVWIFNTLKYLAFIVASLAGVFLTSDCLSEEKREGTLGLLFLTDLRGYDVAFGKLLATSLRTFYSLLAIFPVMALSFVLGGVPADEFWHSAVSLCNALFFSLTLGMAVSALSRDANRAMSATLGLLVIFVVLLPQVDAVGHLSLLSPSYSFTHTTATFRSNDFWLSVLVSHLFGWSLLAFASWLAPRTWQEKGLRKSFKAKARSSHRPLDQNPIAWIIARDRWAANVTRFVVVAIMVLLVVSIASSRNHSVSAPFATTAASSSVTTNSGNATVYAYSSSVNITTSRAFKISSWCCGLLSFALELWLAAHISRFYIEGKKSGFLELLWVTPIKSNDIIRGQWLGLRRLFLAPLAAQLALTLVIAIVNIVATYSLPAGSSPAAVAAAQSATAVQGVTAVLSALSWAIGMFSLAWFSIWMGVVSKSLNLAVLKTFLFVKALPWIGVGFFSIILFMGAVKSFASSPAVIPFLITSVPQILIIAANFGLIAFARAESRKALSKFSVVA